MGQDTVSMHFQHMNLSNHLHLPVNNASCSVNRRNVSAFVASILPPAKVKVIGGGAGGRLAKLCNWRDAKLFNSMGLAIIDTM